MNIKLSDYRYVRTDEYFSQARFLISHLVMKHPWKNDDRIFRGGYACEVCAHPKLGRRCAAYCKTPCEPLYEEAVQLVEKYGRNMFMRTSFWIDEFCEARETARRYHADLPTVQIVTPRRKDKHCVFFDRKTWNCLLHNTKLKPFGGRYGVCRDSKIKIKEEDNYDALTHYQYIWLNWLLADDGSFANSFKSASELSEKERELKLRYNQLLEEANFLGINLV
jgi:Fe-S-cluster containining protein